jgi:hypothetical protein
VVIVAVVPVILEAPSGVVPSMNNTVPDLPAISEAVNVTDCKYVEGLSEDITSIEVTVTVSVLELLAL